MRFRKDINGLRAIAVIAVVLFHFDPNLVPGGFAGVDVFFVISGFLMTKIIFRGLENETFNLLKFYVSRAKRIIPPLLILCVVLLIFGWNYLTPLDYKALGKHVVSSIVFLSNIIYWKESGYFDAASYEKWLLHTWSLSVEWQFYIVYPVILVALKKTLSLDSLKRLIIVGTVLGFSFCVFSTIKWPNAAYYLLPTRAWEMMVGGLAFLYPVNFKYNKQKLIGWIGIALIMASYIFISRVTSWPGYLSILPVLGTYLIILSNNQSSVITNNIVFQYLGKWSYSIYLWHWPLVVFGQYYNIPYWIFIGVLLSLFFGAISFYYIESNKKNKIYIPVLTLILSYSFLIYKNDGFAYQVPIYVFNMGNIDVRGVDYGKYTWRNHKDTQDLFTTLDKEKMLVIGDSQGGDFINLLLEMGIDDKYEVISRTVPSKCGSVYLYGEEKSEWLSISSDFRNGTIKKEQCFHKWDSIHSDKAIVDADVIIISMNWRPWSIPYTVESIHNIRKRNSDAQIIIVGTKSFGTYLPNFIVKNYGSDIGKLYYEKGVSTGKFDFMERMGNSLAELNNVFYINFKDLICSDERKTCEFLFEEKPILYDNTHSTKQGILLFKSKLNGRLHLS